MTLDEFVSKTATSEAFCMRPKIVCKDGFTMSVQGSNAHYCSPRVSTDSYYEMEIGYPSDVEDVLLEYAENENAPTKTVYPYVPVYIIQEVIDRHGGIDVQATFKNTNP